MGLVNDNLKSVRKKEVMAYFKVLHRHLTKSIEEHGKSTSGRGCISTKYRVPEHDAV